MCSPSVQWLMKHEPMLQQHESMLQNLASTRHPSSSSWFFDRDDQVRELRYDKRSGSRPLRLADGHLRLTAVNHLREHVRRRQTGSPQVKAVATLEPYSIRSRASRFHFQGSRLFSNDTAVRSSNTLT